MFGRNVAAAALIALLPVLAAGTVVAVAPAPAAYASGSSAADLAKRKATVDAAKAKAEDTYEAAGSVVQKAAADYAAASAALPDAQADLATAKGALISASATLARATTDATNAEATAAAANASLAAANQRVDDQRAAITAVATEVYQGSPFLGLNALLTDGNPGQVLDRVGYASQIVATERKTLGVYLQARLSATYELTVAKHEADQADAARVAASNAVVADQKARTAAQTAEDAVNTLVKQKAAALAVAQKNKAQALAAFNELQKESDTIAAQLAEVAKKDGAKKSTGGTSSTTGSRSGYFIMPIHGWKSSDFGMRYDPIYHRYQLHAGVDIAAAGGTPIHAARAGKVVRAGWDGGYGNYTCIDNGLYQGKEIATCYAHQSRILVHVGQKVSQGQVIGRVGETGAATGYHLHFEVRINGKPVQPLDWLPKCFC